MEEKQKVKLFREKSLEAIESPESLNDYLHVTSVGVWLVMAAVIAILLGMILWSIFGSIDTSVELAVSSSDGQAVCYVPYGSLEKVLQQGNVTVNGQSYSLIQDPNAEVEIVSETMNPYLRIAGNLKVGDMMLKVPLDGTLEDGVFTATAVTERLQPISLLLK